MSDSPQRNGARSARISVRVPDAVKRNMQHAIAELAARGQKTNETELVEFLVDEALTGDVADLDDRLRRWRARGGIR